MSTEQEIEQLLDSIGVDAESQARETFPPGDAPAVDEIDDSTDVEMQTHVVERVVPFAPGTGDVKDEVRNFVLTDGSHLSVTLKHRIQCPTCDYILADPDARQHPSRCGEIRCQNWACPACGETCEACGITLCPNCTTGHATKDETYCRRCVTDVDDAVQHDRELERRQQLHTERMDALEHQRIRRKQAVEQAAQRRQQQFSQRIKAKEFKHKLLRTLLDAQQSHSDQPHSGQQSAHFEGIQHTVDTIKQNTR